MNRKVSLLAVVALIALAAFVAATHASPPSGVTPTILARGTFAEFKVKSPNDSPVDFEAKAKSPLDIVVRKHDYAIGSNTGWHTHPGPIFITVTIGQLTYYEADDRPAHRTSSPPATGSSTPGAGTSSGTNQAPSRRTSA